MTIPFEKLKARLLANPKVKAEYDALAAEFEISAELIKARLRAGLSQAELAARMAPANRALPAWMPRRPAAGSVCGCRGLDSLCTYMTRRAPAIVRNRIKARHINIAHGLYPREPLSDVALTAVLAYPGRHVSTTRGRTYAGGLVKFEPKELERIPLPRIEDIHGCLAESA